MLGIAVWEHLAFCNTAPLVWSSFIGHPITAQSSLGPERDMMLLKYIIHTLMGTKLQTLKYTSDKSPLNVWPLLLYFTLVY